MSEREIPSISEEQLDRRGFFKRWLPKAATTALAADVFYSAKIGQPEYEPTNPDSKKIERAAREMFPHLKANRSTFETDQGKTIAVYPGRKNFSRLLAKLAYLDGGEEELNKVTKFIKERGIILSINDHTLSKASRTPSFSPSHPMKVSFDRKFVNDYYTKLKSLDLSDKDNDIYHEAYHCIQQARNPEAYSALKIGSFPLYLGAGIYGGILSGKKVYESITSNSNQETLPSDSEKEKKLTRRKVLGFIAGGATILANSAIYGLGLKSYIEPLELQAYFQTGFKLSEIYDPLIKEIPVPNIPGMIDKKHLEQFTGQGFKFYPQ